MDRATYERLVEDHRLVLELEEFIVNRFLAYTKFTDVKANRFSANDPVTRNIGIVETAKDNNGWGGWKLDTKQMWNAEDDFFVVFHYTYGERGPTTYSDFVKLPKDFVFGELERDVEYAQYLLLKAKFEGGKE